MSEQPAASGKAFLFRNWKSFGEARLPLAPLTVLIGANASGKSNAIEGIRLLSLLARDEGLPNILASLDGARSPLRGSRDTLARFGHSEFTLGFDRGSKEWPGLEVTLGRRNGGLHLVQERVTDPAHKLPLYEVSGPAAEKGPGDGELIHVRYRSAPDAVAPEPMVFGGQRSVFQRMVSVASAWASKAFSPETMVSVCVDLWHRLSLVVFLDASVSAMRGYVQPSHRLEPDGSNVSGVLEWLCTPHGEYPLDFALRARQTVLSLVQSLPEQDIVGIDFVREPLGKVLVELTESFGGVERKVNATQLSDGTLRVLAIAAAVLTAAPRSVVVVEEVDNGIHPSRVGRLIERIRELAVERGVHVLVTTHNPALLDALPAAAVPDVVVCYRDPHDGTSKLSRLEELPDYVALTAAGTVGQAMTSGALEQATHQPTTPELRRERALAWLAQRGAPEAR